MVINLTIPSYVLAVVVLYYCGLWVLSMRPRRRPVGQTASPLFVVVIPAHNESVVIGRTVSAALNLPYAGDHRVLLMDDASTDGTAAAALRSAADNPSLRVITRSPSVGGRGKSHVLNDAYKHIEEWLGDSEIWLAGHGADSIVLVIVDADGRLTSNAFEAAAPYFADSSVGGVQVGVRITNSRDSILARMQDMEFVGFSGFVQTARDRIGSVGLGGNGQFTRLLMLRSMGARPWRDDALTEDLDLGVRAALGGWRNRYCGAIWVEQQGLTAWRPLLRQRTRWTQGHYQAWRHLPVLLGRHRDVKVPIRTRLDIAAYLILVLTVMLVLTVLMIGVLSVTGLVITENNFLSFLGEGELYRCAQLILTWTPLLGMVAAYQRHSKQPLRWWEVPAFSLIFAAYTYVWAITTVRAWIRMAMGRGSWVKTPRVAEAVAS